jgi:aspartate kinase
MSIVSKFGGSSVKDSEAMLRCARIVAANKERKFIVISATQNTTNQLEEVVRLSKLNLKSELDFLLLEIENRHKKIALELNFTETNKLQSLFTELRSFSNELIAAKTCSAAQMDSVYAMGERISSLLFTSALIKIGVESELLDARDFIITDNAYNRARPQISLIAKKMQSLLPLKKVYVTQGFIGKTPEGETTTLGREGSDFSAALIGEAINASAIEIWTDVPGVATIDPRIDIRAKYLTDLSYDEATTMAQLGSKVLFSETLMPAQRKNIPVFVNSSLKPEAPGTWIRAESIDQVSDVKSIAVYPNHIQIDFVIFEDSLKIETLKNIADWIQKYNLDLTQLTWKNNITSLWIYVRKGLSEEASNALFNLSNLGKIKLTDKLTLVSTVGRKTETIIVPTDKAHDLAKILHQDLLAK